MDPVQEKPTPGSPLRIAQLWREHMQAGCPAELKDVEIAGIDARTLDAEITACVSAMLTRALSVDERIERRLGEVLAALEQTEAQADPPLAQYCARLNRLLSAVLAERRIGAA